MSKHRDRRVDKYIEGLPQWQQAVCREVREIVHSADPEVEETIKRRVQPYFVLEGNVCALLAAKRHVAVFLYDGAIVLDPEGIITGGHENKAARQISIHDGEEIKADALRELFRQIIANNRAGGWCRISASRRRSDDSARAGGRERPPGGGAGLFCRRRNDGRGRARKVALLVRRAAASG